MILLDILQGTLGRGHPLGTAVVTEALVEEALIRIAAIEVGKPSGVRLFALPRNYTAADKVSTTYTARRDSINVNLHHL